MHLADSGVLPGRHGLVSFYVKLFFLSGSSTSRGERGLAGWCPSRRTGHRLSEPPAWLHCADEKIEQGLGEDQLQELNQ